MKQFFLFIVLMRAIAAIIITNSHYTGVYPTDLIANGGLLGDVLFFSISGFCLASPRDNFGKWYLKRVIRVYTPSWVMTIVYIILGAYILTNLQDVFDFFIWPTHWHFVASIILLYIPLFFVSKYIEMNKRNFLRLTGLILFIQIILYFTVYDYSFYHIDTVREPMIEFLFFQSMLLGLHFRWKAENKSNNYRISLVKIGIVIFFTVLYFMSKMLFVKLPEIAPLQLINPIVLWGLLYVLFELFMSIDSLLIRIEKSFLWKCISFLSNRTLEIYLVQYIIIAQCKIGPFPINWIILTSLIILSASILHWGSQKIIKYIQI